MQGRGEHIPALNQVKSIIAGSNFTGNVFALTQVPPHRTLQDFRMAIGRTEMGLQRGNIS